jgi:hypothetical protein
VSVCDCGNDREAEPSTGSGSVSAAEPVEGVFEELLRESLLLADDAKRQCLVPVDCLESYRASAVAERVFNGGR